MAEESNVKKKVNPDELISTFRSKKELYTYLT
jgi:hypothetical protein